MARGRRGGQRPGLARFNETHCRAQVSQGQRDRSLAKTEEQVGPLVGNDIEAGADHVLEDAQGHLEVRRVDAHVDGARRCAGVIDHLLQRGVVRRRRREEHAGVLREADDRAQQRLVVGHRLHQGQEVHRARGDRHHGVPVCRQRHEMRQTENAAATHLVLDQGGLASGHTDALRERPHQHVDPGALGAGHQEAQGLAREGRRRLRSGSVRREPGTERCAGRGARETASGRIDRPGRHRLNRGDPEVRRAAHWHSFASCGPARWVTCRLHAQDRTAADCRSAECPRQSVAVRFKGD